MTRSIWADLVSQCLDKVSEKWPDRPVQSKSETNGLVTGLLYSGNIHETVPKKLLLDNRLTPLERNGWLVFKMLLDKEGFAVPRYEDLQPYLSMAPYGGKASKETIARVIHILRLTRWLSLVSKGRDSITGQLLGSLYILHDEPVTPSEALELDKSYMDFVLKCNEHANKSVKYAAIGAYSDLQEDKLVVSRLEHIAKRIKQQSLTSVVQLENYQISPSSVSELSLVRSENNLSSDTEPSKNSLVRNNFNPSSVSELRPNPLNTNLVRNPNSYSTSTVYIQNSTSTVLNHPLLKNINKQQQSKLLELTNDLDTSLVTQVFEEFENRCNDASNPINNPIGYLFGLLKKAKNNEFKPWFSSTNTNLKNHSPPTAIVSSVPYCRDTSTPIPSEVKQKILELKNLLNINKI